MADDPTADTPLTQFQIEVARTFFSLPAAEQFVLTGGAALVAHQLTHRPTQDLDFLTSGDVYVRAARDEFETAASQRGWSVTRIRDTPMFCRLEVQGDDDLLVDLMVDTPPRGAPALSILGRTLARDDLAGRKLLALFDRAAARDFVDVFELTQTYSPEVLMERAALIDDLGFDLRELGRQMRMLERYSDRDLPCSADSVPALRALFAEWRSTLEGNEDRQGRRRPRGGARHLLGAPKGFKYSMPWLGAPGRRTVPDQAAAPGRGR